MPGRMLIVLADDDEGHRVLVAEAIKDAGMHARLRTVNDGEELLDYLKHRGTYADDEDTQQPAVVLLDLNMPRMHGHDALHEIKHDPELCAIPVIVFSTSAREKDVLRTYFEGGNSHIIKPGDYPGLVETMKSFSLYWNDTVSLPPAAPR